MIKELLQEGFILKNEKHYKKAIEIFYKALEEDNTSNELLLEIADTYHKMQNEERALIYIEQILKKDAQHIATLKLLKEIFIEKNALEEAEQTAKNIYCISQDINDLAEIFRLLNLQNKYDEIFEYNIENTNAKIQIEEAKALLRKKEFEKAQNLITESIEFINKNSEEYQKLLLILGQVLYAQDKKDECIDLIKQLHVDEQNSELLNFCAIIDDCKGDSKAACKKLQKAIANEPNNDKFYYNLSNIYFKQKDYVYDKKYYNLAISLNPTNNNYHFSLANLYYIEKHYKKALEELPENLYEAKILKIVILYETGFLALAKSELAKLLKLFPENEVLIKYNSMINKELGIK